MSELAFDKEGNPFRFSRRTKKLRPRRWKNAGQRGTCAAVLDPNGEQLFVDAETEYVEFRAAVGNVPGFYRVDQCDEDGVPIEHAPPAYVSIESTRNAAPIGDADPRDAIIRDLAQINADVTRTIAERFGNVMQSAADILRAADSAGLPRRAPSPAPTLHKDDENEDEDDEIADDVVELAAPAPPFGPLQPLVEMAMPHLPKLGAFLWVKFQEFMKQNATPPPVEAPPAPAPDTISAATASPGPQSGGTAEPSAAAASPAPAPPASPPPPPPPPAPASPISMPSTDAAPVADAPGRAAMVAPAPSVASSQIAPSLGPAPRVDATLATDTPSGNAAAALGPSGAPSPIAPAPNAPSPSATSSAPPTALAVDSAPTDAIRKAPLAPTPEQWAHLRAIVARMSAREAAITEAVATRMTPEVRMTWLAELSVLGVDQAVQAVRSMIPKAAPAKPQVANPITATGASTKPEAASATKPQTTEPSAAAGTSTNSLTTLAPATKPPSLAKPGSATHASTDATAAMKHPVPSPDGMDHFLAIQAALTPEEAASAQAAASALSPLDLRALVDELSGMSVPEAVERVRALLAEATKPVAT